MSRSQIKVVNSSINLVKAIESNSTSWGELREELERDGYIKGDVRAVIRENSCSLELDSAQVPEGEFTLFIVPKKSKAGNDSYEDMSFSELRAECARRDSITGNAGNYGSSVVMRNLLREDDARQTSFASNSGLDRFESLVERLEGVARILESVEVGAHSIEAVDPRTVLTEEDEEFLDEISNL